GDKEVGALAARRIGRAIAGAARVRERPRDDDRHAEKCPQSHADVSGLVVGPAGPGAAMGLDVVSDRDRRVDASLAEDFAVKGDFMLRWTVAYFTLLSVVSLSGQRAQAPRPGGSPQGSPPV